MSEVWDKYEKAILKVADKLFNEHNLALTPLKKDACTYRVAPKVSWADSLMAIKETINGVGMFEFSSIKELCNSGPWTVRQAVLNHLHWIADWPDVYEGTKASYLVERSLR